MWQKIRLFWFMVFNATFNNISVISWRSILLVEESRENHRPVANHWQTLSQNVVSSTPRHERGSNSQLSDSEWLIIIIIKKNSIFFNEDVNEQTNKYDPTLRVKYLKKNNRLCTSSEVQTYPWHCSLISTSLIFTLCKIQI